jgi:hypothetical protein
VSRKSHIPPDLVVKSQDIDIGSSTPNRGAVKL